MDNELAKEVLPRILAESETHRVVKIDQFYYLEVKKYNAMNEPYYETVLYRSHKTKFEHSAKNNLEDAFLFLCGVIEEKENPVNVFGAGD